MDFHNIVQLFQKTLMKKKFQNNLKNTKYLRLASMEN